MRWEARGDREEEGKENGKGGREVPYRHSFSHFEPSNYSRSVEYGICIQLYSIQMMLTRKQLMNQKNNTIKEKKHVNIKELQLKNRNRTASK